MGMNENDYIKTISGNITFENLAKPTDGVGMRKISILKLINKKIFYLKEKNRKNINKILKMKIGKK